MLTDGGLSVDEAGIILKEVEVHTLMKHSPFKTWECHVSELSGDVRGFLVGLCSATIEHYFGRHIGHQMINNPAMKAAMQAFMNGE